MYYSSSPLQPRESRVDVKSITEIGHIMNMEIVAEHVENDLVLDVLRPLSVDYCQGYMMGRPEPVR